MPWISLGTIVVSLLTLSFLKKKVSDEALEQTLYEQRALAVRQVFAGLDNDQKISGERLRKLLVKYGIIFRDRWNVDYYKFVARMEEDGVVSHENLVKHLKNSEYFETRRYSLRKSAESQG